MSELDVLKDIAISLEHSMDAVAKCCVCGQIDDNEFFCVLLRLDCKIARHMQDIRLREDVAKGGMA